MKKLIKPVVLILMFVLHCAVAQQNPQAQTSGQGLKPDAGTPQPPKPKSKIVQVTRPSAIKEEFFTNKAQVADMFSDALLKFTGQPNSAKAWSSLGITKSDVVGIKISCGGGPVMSTRKNLIDEIIRGLQSAGVPLKNIVLWDKFQDDMMRANFYVRPASDLQYGISAVVPQTGFDQKLFYVNEILGKLIWGDCNFQGTGPNPYTEDPDAKKLPDQTSNKSYFSILLTQTFTKVINVPCASDSDTVGLHGCLSTLALDSVDNTRRFWSQGGGGDPAIPEILDRDLFRKKVVLHVLDSLLFQYAGGPAFRPEFVQAAGTIYLGTDPVAIDSLALAAAEKMRADNNVPPIGKVAKHIKSAESNDLGTTDPKQIDLIQLP